MRKKKGIIPKIASFFLAFSMLLGVVAGTSVISEGATHPDAVTKIEAQLRDGSGPIYEIGQYQVFHLKASFAYQFLYRRSKYLTRVTQIGRAHV